VKWLVAGFFNYYYYYYYYFIYLFFFLLYSIQTGSGGVPSGSAKLKRQEYEADHEPPCSVEIKNGGAILPLLHFAFSRRDAY
jgi:hypothetical protein